MKNKKMVYLLGLVVVLLWGFIIYKLFDAASGGDTDTGVVADQPKKEVYNDFAVVEDTTHLLLNYRDPFGIVKRKDTVTVKKSRAKINVLSVKSAINWSFIKYSGFVRNPDSKKIIALLSINGKNVMMTEGETSGSVKLLKNMRDSIQVFYSGQTKFIHLNPRTI